MKLIAFIFAVFSVFLIISGSWKIAAPWIIETATSLPNLFTQPEQSSTTTTENYALEQCRNSTNRTSSTPELIECAFLEGRITLDQRILYLVYAVGDFKKLPSKYRSNVGWDGTGVVKELNDIVSSANKFCVLSSVVRSELIEHFPLAVLCP